MYALRDRNAAQPQESTRTNRPARGERQPWVSLRTLKIVGVVLPITFVVLVEWVRFTVVETDLALEADPGEIGGHVALALLTVACVVAFAAVMFFFIDRAQGQVLRQNRQLAALNAVSTAVRDDLSVERIIDQTLDSVLVSSGALSASITVPGGDGDRVGVVPAGAHTGGPVVDIALTAGTSSIGVLRLQLPAGQARPDALTADTLQTIGQQVAYAIQRAQLIGDLKRGQQEGHALYEVLLQISNQRPLAVTLRDIVRDARDHLGAERACMCLDETASRIVLVENLPGGRPVRPDGLLCVTPDGTAPGGRPTGQPGCLGSRLSVPVGAPGAAYGELWVARSGEPFTERDRRLLVTLAELTTIALAGARMRENERQGAIVAERERIARELHDSLAQVLGVTHLRLHALRRRPAVRASRDVEDELQDLAGICQEGYRDVREAILGLGQSSRPDRNLIDSLDAYLQAYTRQSGIVTSLECSPDRDLVLLPRCEIQVIRVIQEALTNVRKHSGAGSAVVRIGADEGCVRFSVTDDGDGFDPGAVPLDRDGYGFGLSSMQERVRLIGGRLGIRSVPGQGTTLEVEVPMAMVQSPRRAQVAALGGGTRGA